MVIALNIRPSYPAVRLQRAPVTRRCWSELLTIFGVVPGEQNSVTFQIPAVRDQLRQSCLVSDRVPPVQNAPEPLAGLAVRSLSVESRHVEPWPSLLPAPLPSRAHRASPACLAKASQRVAIRTWLGAPYLAGGARFPVGKQPPHYLAAAWSLYETPLPPCPTAKHRHTPPPVPDGVEEC